MKPNILVIGQYPSDYDQELFQIANVRVIDFTNKFENYTADSLKQAIFDSEMVLGTAVGTDLMSGLMIGLVLMSGYPLYVVNNAVTLTNLISSRYPEIIFLPDDKGVSFIQMVKNYIEVLNSPGEDDGRPDV